MTPKFVPDYMATSLLDVDFQALKKAGVQYIAFDADSTLVNYGGRKLSSKTRAFLQQNRKLFRKWCIASNRITNDLLPLGESMDASVIRATLFVRKPQGKFFDRVVKHFGGKPEQIAMVGDKLIADMYGAKKAGFVTVWVERIGPDNPWDQVIQTRKLEKRLMRRYLP